jgi:hypothetical protein
MERPRFFLKTETTNSTEYQTILDVEISSDAIGLSFFR